MFDTRQAVRLKEYCYFIREVEYNALCCSESGYFGDLLSRDA
jgi:hypothetical protein